MTFIPLEKLNLSSWAQVVHLQRDRKIEYIIHRQDIIYFFPSDFVQLRKQFWSSCFHIYYLVIFDQNYFSPHIPVKTERNKLSSFKKYFVYLQSNQQFQLPSISPVLSKTNKTTNWFRDHRSILKCIVCLPEWRKNYIAFLPGKSNSIYHEDITLARVLWWGKDHRITEC